MTHTLAMGGANRSMLQLMKELRARHNINPIVLAPKGKVAISIVDKCMEENIRCITAKYYWFKGSKNFKCYIKFVLNWIWYYPCLALSLHNLRIDLVHSNGSVIDVGGIISRLKKVKHVWHLREFGDWDFNLFSVFGTWGERHIYRMGDCFIAISKRIKERFMEVIPEEKIELVYNGIAMRTPDLDAMHLNTLVQFVIVGVVQESKNQLEALRAMSLLKAQGYNGHLNIIGSADSTYLGMLKDYIKNNDLLDVVSFWGERDDVPALLKQMDVGLMLSKSEAFGRVTIEYMLQNLAVIASDTGANPEIIEDGKNGFLYSWGNVEDLASKMRACIVSKTLLNQLALNGKTMASQRFTSIQNSDAIFDIYGRYLN